MSLYSDLFRIFIFPFGYKLYLGHFLQILPGLFLRFPDYEKTFIKIAEIGILLVSAEKGVSLLLAQPA